jgi:nucleotide-binding universal stress UspA family protein
MFTHILIATDGSEYAEKALRAAADLGRRYAARVTAMTAFDPIPRDLGSPHEEQLTARRLGAAEELMRAAAEELERAGVAHETEVLPGPAAQAILTLARNRGCDLIVMGSRGLSPLGQLLLGSVSLRIVQEAQCPVLITR